MDSINERKIFTATVLSDLHSIKMPHVGQVPIGKAIFYENKKRIFIRCGRKFGKTDLVIYLAYRWCMLYPNSWCYYIAPLKDQVNDLVWANGRMPYYLPPHLINKYGVRPSKTEFRVNFGNGSFIKCDGSDSYEKGRGYSATGISFYDEYKDHNEKFHEGFEDNLAITDAPLVFIGTPPDESEDDYEKWTKMEERVRRSEVGACFHMPGTMNPHVSADYFIRKKKECIENGEEWRYQKEILAEYVKANSRSIFPFLDEEKHVISHDMLMAEINFSPNDWDYYVAFDPGSAKCFAVLLMAVNRFTKAIRLLDEIYADKMGENNVGRVYPDTIIKLKEFNPFLAGWLGCYDNAAAWFINEVNNEYPESDLPLMPCDKDLRNKENKLSMINKILKKGNFKMSTKCIKMFWEMRKYATDENGKIPKKDDHLIDCFRYLLNLANYTTINDEPEPSDFEKHNRRAFRPEERIEDDFKMEGEYDRILFDT